MNNVDLRNIQTRNFTLQEFANTKDYNRIKIDLELIFKLQQLRDIVGRIHVTSGYRTLEFNRTLKSSDTSNHIKGLAADIKFDFSTWNKESLVMLCSFIGFKNIGFYWEDDGDLNRLHLDVGKPHGGNVYVMDWDIRNNLLKSECR
jgi:uncharacterized protein YcbK (DUF882 family)